MKTKNVVKMVTTLLILLVSMTIVLANDSVVGLPEHEPDVGTCEYPGQPPCNPDPTVTIEPDPTVTVPVEDPNDVGTCESPGQPPCNPEAQIPENNMPENNGQGDSSDITLIVEESTDVGPCIIEDPNSPCNGETNPPDVGPCIIEDPNSPCNEQQIVPQETEEITYAVEELPQTDTVPENLFVKIIKKLFFWI